MSEIEAESLLRQERDNESFCIRYRSDPESGEVTFREPSVRAPGVAAFSGWRGLAVGLAGLALSACADPNPEPSQIRESECVFDHGVVRYTLPRGEGDCPPPAAPPRAEASPGYGPPPPALPEVVEPAPPEQPCAPERLEPQFEPREKVPLKGKRVRKRKRVRKPQGKRLRLPDDEPIQGLLLE